MNSPFLSQYWSKVSPEPNSGCWLWTGAINQAGYGRASLGGARTSAHRLAYELDRTNIPAGLQIDHLCRVTCCVNPDHLEPVTALENVRRALLHRRKAGHCRNAHELNSENVIIRKNGRSICRLCERASRLPHAKTPAARAYRLAWHKANEKRKSAIRAARKTAVA